MEAAELNTALEKLWAGRYGGLLFQDDQHTGVTIEFGDQNVMEIRGLGPDLPPFIRLGGPKETEVSEDGMAWEQVPTEYGFEIYRLLDPRIFVKRVESLKQWKDKELTYIAGEYDVESLGLRLPKELVEWMKKHEGPKRWLQFTIREGVIQEFMQSDFPPSDHKINVRIVPC